MMDIDLPIENVYQQKIAFEDSFAAIPRQLPFSIDLDAVDLNWDEGERELLLEDAETAWLTQQLPGGVHCRPDGGESGSWIKLGWAYNDTISKPQQDLANEPLKSPQYPEIVMRAAARLHPALGKYAEDFPTRYSHYGGYYPMTKENWPLIGPLGVDGAFVVGALSGFGSMSACAAGAICGGWISGNDLPAYAAQLSPARYADSDLMTELTGAQSRGIL
jgi:glycine/D-amino acid oxidase-like deaminating enzyme